MQPIQHKYKNIQCYGLWGTYDDGLEWIQQTPELQAKSKTVLWLGSSIGNFTRQEAHDFLQSYAEGALKTGSDDRLIVGIDANSEHGKILRAYNDDQGVTREFILNGLKHANTLLGEEVFKEGEWEYVGEVDDVSTPSINPV
jgi:L-histidine Nalpha-methyltransferase / hercynylcysteine S-oxide synthase